jgi:hypothetical protein
VLVLFIINIFFLRYQGIFLYEKGMHLCVARLINSKYQTWSTWWRELCPQYMS